MKQCKSRVGHSSGSPPLWNHLNTGQSTHPIQTLGDTASSPSMLGAGRNHRTWNLFLWFPSNVFLVYYTHIIFSSDETKYIIFLHNSLNKGFIHHIYLIPWTFRLEQRGHQHFILLWPERNYRSDLYILLITLPSRAAKLTDNKGVKQPNKWILITSSIKDLKGPSVFYGTYHWLK